MTEGTPDLVSMADVARLAGVSRAAAGNWKSREVDFPEAHSKGSRGPLYDRADVVEWLLKTNRMDGGSLEAGAVFRLANGFRASLDHEDTFIVILLLLALRKRIGPEKWDTFSKVPGEKIDERFKSLVIECFPYASSLLPSVPISASGIFDSIDILARLPEEGFSRTAEDLLDEMDASTSHRRVRNSTPPRIRRLVVGLAGLGESFYDPSSGTGQLLVDAVTQVPWDGTLVFCQEVNQRSWALAKINFFIHGIEAELAHGDTLLEDKFRGLQVDRIVADPPWSLKINGAEAVADDPRWVWGEPGRSPQDSNMAWIQHCLHHLKEDGRAVVVMPNGVLFQGGRTSRARQLMVKSGVLDAVISLPPGSFEGTGISVCLMIFVKGRGLENGDPMPTLMINAEDSSGRESGRPRGFDEGQLAEILSIYGDWTNRITPTSDMASVVSYRELAEHDFVLVPQRYVTPIGSELSDKQLLAERVRLHEKLSRTLSVCESNDRILREILDEEN